LVLAALSRTSRMGGRVCLGGRSSACTIYVSLQKFKIGGHGRENLTSFLVSSKSEASMFS